MAALRSLVTRATLTLILFALPSVAAETSPQIPESAVEVPSWDRVTAAFQKLVDLVYELPGSPRVVQAELAYNTIEQYLVKAPSYVPDAELSARLSRFFDMYLAERGFIYGGSRMKDTILEPTYARLTRSPLIDQDAAYRDMIKAQGEFILSRLLIFNLPHDTVEKLFGGDGLYGQGVEQDILTAAREMSCGTREKISMQRGLGALRRSLLSPELDTTARVDMTIQLVHRFLDDWYRAMYGMELGNVAKDSGLEIYGGFSLPNQYYRVTGPKLPLPAECQGSTYWPIHYSRAFITQVIKPIYQVLMNGPQTEASTKLVNKLPQVIHTAGKYQYFDSSSTDYRVGYYFEAIDR